MSPHIIKNALYVLFGLLEFLIISRAVLSFIVPAISSRVWHNIYSVICAITEPLLWPIRKLLHRIPALESLPIDFSPIVVLLILSFLGNIVAWL